MMKKNLNNNKLLLNKNVKYTFKFNTMSKIKDKKILNNDEIIIVKNLIEKYNDELNRIKNIYSKFELYNYNFKNKYKYDHFSIEIKKRENITSYCNVKEFIKLYSKEINDKIKYKFNKKINKQDYCVIFILDIIDRLFELYIKTLKYGIELLKNKPYIIRYNENNKYLPLIYHNNFIIYNDKIKIKHLNMINNINIIGKENNGYIILYKTKLKNRINIYFD